MSDLSVMAAVERAAAAQADYSGLCMERTFPDMFQAPSHPRWCRQSDGAKEILRRQIIVGVFAYLFHRSNENCHLELERQHLLKNIEANWLAIFKEIMGITDRDFGGRKPDDPARALAWLGWTNRATANLLVDEFRREEVRRLQHKERLMRTSAFDEREQPTDEMWAKRNLEILNGAEVREALAKEAQSSFDFAAPAQTPRA